MGLCQATIQSIEALGGNMSFRASRINQVHTIQTSEHAFIHILRRQFDGGRTPKSWLVKFIQIFVMTLDPRVNTDESLDFENTTTPECTGLGINLR